MKKKLSVVQIVILLVCCILPFVDGMFHWLCSNAFEGYNTKTPISLDNLIRVQSVGAGEIVYWLFFSAMVATIIYCLVYLFCEPEWAQQKATILLPSAALLLGVVLVFSVDAHHDSFKASTGFTRNIGVSLGILAWVELILLASVVIVECYKQYKCDE